MDPRDLMLELLVLLFLKSWLMFAGWRILKVKRWMKKLSSNSGASSARPLSRWVLAAD